MIRKKIILEYLIFAFLFSKIVVSKEIVMIGVVINMSILLHTGLGIGTVVFSLNSCNDK